MAFFYAIIPSTVFVNNFLFIRNFVVTKRISNSSLEFKTFGTTILVLPTYLNSKKFGEGLFILYGVSMWRYVVGI